MIETSLASTARSVIVALYHPPQDSFPNVTNDCSERQRGSADFAWNRPLARAWYGDTPEFRTVSDADYARPRGDGGGLHAGSGGPEHRLGPLASAGRRDRRPFRSAHYDDGGRGDLRRRPGHHGCGPRRAGADRLRRL